MNRDVISFENVSKFYGDVLGVNRVDLQIPSGITSLVGPNGSGKTTLMNLITGLLQVTRGRILVRGVPPDRPEELNHFVGYCTSYDSFPKGATGYQFLYSYLRVHGKTDGDAKRLTGRALERVSLSEAASRKIAGYSKGMRQRIKLAQAISHDPAVLVLDEPLNGLDPMVRAEVIALLRQLAGEGRHVVVSSHILHEVDLISDRVILLSQGYVVAEGAIRDVRSEIVSHPIQVLVRCDQPALLASKVFEQDHVVEARILPDRSGVLVHTKDADQFYLLLNRIIVNSQIRVELVAPADDDVQAVYRYLVGTEGGIGLIPEATLALEAVDPGLYRRQILAVLRMELRKIMLGTRAVIVYLLALLPVLILALRAVAISRGWMHAGGSPELLFAQIYQSFLLRFAVFSGCAWIFTNLFRGEMLDRSLHYYYLAPIRRDHLVAGKYIAGLAASSAIFVTCTVVSYVLLWLPDRAEGMDHLLVNPGPVRVLQYALISALACAGYGAVFLLAGVFVRNPMIPTVIFLFWECVNFLLPPILKMFSVIHYLVSLCPVAISEGSFAVIAEPTPWWASVPGLFVVTGLILWAAARRVRRSEILYGTD